MDQATLLRKMSPKERLEQALQLSDLVRELARENIKRDKTLSPKEVAQQLRKRLEILNP